MTFFTLSSESKKELMSHMCSNKKKREWSEIWKNSSKVIILRSARLKVLDQKRRLTTNRALEHDWTGRQRKLQDFFIEDATFADGTNSAMRFSVWWKCIDKEHIDPRIPCIPNQLCSDQKYCVLWRRNHVTAWCSKACIGKHIDCRIITRRRRELIIVDFFLTSGRKFQFCFSY